MRTVPGDRSSPLRPATWDEALDAVAEAVRATQRRYGRDAVGCFGGGGLTNEKAYLLGKFARTVLRTRSIDYNGRWCMSSAAAASTRTFGIDRGLPFPVADLALADVLLLVGANPAETMPPLMQHLEAGRERGARHVVVDPRATATARTAHVHLQPRPGTDAALANGLLHLVVRRGWVDEEYVATRTVEFETVRESVTGYWPDRVERITGVPAADLETVAELLGTASTAMVITARGAEQHASGTATAQAFINLALALGLPGRPGSGYGTLTGQGNGQGGREHGQKADQLPGYRKITDLAHRAHVAGVWGVDPTRLPGPGVSATEMLRALGTPGGVRTLLLLASNVTVSAPDAGTVTERVDALDFLIVADLFLSESAARADVVLPVAMWAEEEGTMTNLEGRVLRRRRALDPPPGVRTDLDVLAGVADRLGLGHLMTTDAATAFEELGRASAGGVADYGGITYDRIEDEQGVFWPCTDADDPGTPRLFADRFAHPDGLARFTRAEYREPAERTDPEFPYVLTTGRVMRQYQSGTQTRRVAALAGDEVGPDGTVLPHAELHPDLARRCGVTDGEPVQLRTRRGVAVFRARLTTGIRTDTVFVPFHWAGTSRANTLTHDALDPVSRMPSFKACAVAVGPDPRTQHATGRHAHGAHPRAVAAGPTEGTRLGQSPDLPAGRLRADRQGPGRPGAARPGPELHGARRRGGADGVLPGRQQHRRARRGRAGARRGADAVLPHRRQGRRARAPAGGRGPGAGHHARGARGRRGGRLGRRHRRPRSRGGVTWPGGRATTTGGGTSSSSATAWRVRARSRRSSSAGAPSSSAITMFGEEPYGNYNRIMLSNVLAGLESEEAIFLNSMAWYDENAITLHAGVRVGRIDRHARTVRATDGSRTPYDALVIATGSSAFVPDIPGMRTVGRGFHQGVFRFRTLDDTRAMIRYARTHKRAVVIGGGLLGLEAARGLQTHGVDVTVVHGPGHLMNQQLDAAGGYVLRRGVENLGIAVVTSARTVGVLGDDRDLGRAARRRARPRPATWSWWPRASGPTRRSAATSGFLVERGIVVDDQMRALDDQGTPDPAVFAVGECVQHRDQVYGLVAPLWEQARVLADVLTGTDPSAQYHGSRTATKLKVAGIDVASMGVTAPERPDDDHIVVSEPRRGLYKSVVVRDDRLIGATLVGDLEKVAPLIQAFDRGSPLPEDRIALLFDLGTAPVEVGVAELPDETTVCNCNGVSKGTIAACVRGGVASVAGVMDATRAGKGCGSCKTLVAQVVEWAADGDLRGRRVGVLVRARCPVRQGRARGARPRARPALGVGGVRRPRAGRGRGRQVEDGADLAAAHDLGRRRRRRARRALHQRPRARQHPARRHVLGGPADEGRRHVRGPAAPHRRRRGQARASR